MERDKERIRIVVDIFSYDDLEAYALIPLCEELKSSGLFPEKYLV